MSTFDPASGDAEQRLDELDDAELVELRDFLRTGGPHVEPEVVAIYPATIGEVQLTLGEPNELDIGAVVGSMITERREGSRFFIRVGCAPAQVPYTFTFQLSGRDDFEGIEAYADPRFVSIVSNFVIEHHEQDCVAEDIALGKWVLDATAALERLAALDAEAIPTIQVLLTLPEGADDGSVVLADISIVEAVVDDAASASEPNPQGSSVPSSTG